MDNRFKIENLAGSSSSSLLRGARICQIRILIVTDGSIHFEATDFGFSLSELIKTLQETARPWEDLTITTARRGQDNDVCTPNPNFRFESATFNINQFDQVWLFGHVGEDDPLQFLNDSELRVLYDFMNDGGGVFATGDHESLGFALCGNIPRVKSMRKWKFKNASSPELRAPGRDDATRIDTLRVGIDTGFQLSDQADSVPQEIRPKYYANAGGVGAQPHPLLADRYSAITVLPDHMHEGECILPTVLTDSFAFDGGETFDEYPTLPKSTVRLAPDQVALSTSASGYLQGDLVDDVPPVEPRGFLTIVAYDGQLVEREKNGQTVKIGRVVVDSSFHHFLDINLNGTGAGDPTKKGFFDCCGNPTKDYAAFKKYYRNIVTWLYPANGRFHYYRSFLLHLRFSADLIEELPTSPSFDFNEIIRAGSVTRRAIAARFSPSEAISCALALIESLPTEFSSEIEKLVNPWRPFPEGSLFNVLINSNFFLCSILGIAVLGIAAHLPADPFEAAQSLDQNEKLQDEFSAFIAESMTQRLGGLLEFAKQSRMSLSAL